MLDNYFQKKKKKVGKKKKDPSEYSPEKLKKRIYRKLKEVFKFDSFRKQQYEIIESVVRKNDVFVLAPTGAGKSLIYQLSSLVCKKPGVSIIISPLLALMNDQISFLKSKDIRCGMWNSNVKVTEKRKLLKDLNRRKPKTRILYTTPESLFTGDLQKMIKKLYENEQLNFFAIDEAHVISSWGHSFRKKCRINLTKIRDIYKKTPIVALTATATRKVKEDIMTILKFNKPKVFVSSFNRKEIEYEIRYKDSVANGMDFDLVKYVKKRKDQFGIIYARTRKDVDSYVNFFKRKKFSSVEGFHSGKRKKERERIQEDWEKGKIKILISTIAFGMGIDSREPLRYVIHLCIPQSIESFYQQSGRCGRDRKKAYSLMYYSIDDKNTLEYLISADKNTDKDRKKVILSNFKNICMMCETPTCRRHFILNYFDERIPPGSDICQKTCCYCKDPENTKSNILKGCKRVRKSQNLFSTNFNYSKFGASTFYDDDIESFGSNDRTRFRNSITKKASFSSSSSVGFTKASTFAAKKRREQYEMSRINPIMEGQSLESYFDQLEQIEENGGNGGRRFGGSQNLNFGRRKNSVSKQSRIGMFNSNGQIIGVTKTTSNFGFRSAKSFLDGKEKSSKKNTKKRKRLSLNDKINILNKKRRKFG